MAASPAVTDKPITKPVGRQQKVTVQRTRGVVDWRPAFLSALEETGVISHAASAANISRKAVWLERNTEPEFAEAFDQSLKAGALLLEAEAVRRASEGLIRKKFTKAGVPIIDPATGEQYVEREFSDTLLLALLKRNFPDQYRERANETHVTAVTNNTVIMFDESRLRELQERRQAQLVDTAKTI